MAQMIKNPPAMWKTWLQSLGWEDPLEKEMASHSSMFAWTIKWTDSMESHRVGHNWVTFTWCWEILKAGGEEDNRGWNGWMASQTQWTWVQHLHEMVKDKETWCAAVHRAAKSQMWLSDWTTKTTTNITLGLAFFHSQRFWWACLSDLLLLYKAMTQFRIFFQIHMGMKWLELNCYCIVLKRRSPKYLLKTCSSCPFLLFLRTYYTDWFWFSELPNS